MEKCNHKWKRKRVDIGYKYIVSKCKKCKGIRVKEPEALCEANHMIPKEYANLRLNKDSLEKAKDRLKKALENF